MRDTCGRFGDLHVWSDRANLEVDLSVTALAAAACMPSRIDSGKHPDCRAPDWVTTAESESDSLTPRYI